MSTAPLPNPPQKSNALVWVLGFVGAGLVLVVLLGLFVAGVVLKNFRVSQKNEQVQIQTPGGEITVSKTEPAPSAIGLPMYPGAQPIESGADVEISTPGDERVGITAAHFRSADSLDKVDAWYRERLGSEFEREGRGSKKITFGIHGMHVDADGIAYVSDRNDFTRVVALQPKRGYVEIALVRAGKREAQ